MQALTPKRVPVNSSIRCLRISDTLEYQVALYIFVAGLRGNAAIFLQQEDSFAFGKWR